MSRLRRRFVDVSTHAALLVVALTFVAPLLWLVSASLASPTDLLTNGGLVLTSRPTSANFHDALSINRFGRSYANTIGVAVIRVVVQVALCSIGGYALSRPGAGRRTAVLAILLSAQAIPSFAPAVSWMIMFGRIGLSNSYTALVVPTLFSAFGLLFFRQTFLTLPREIVEAAVVDGASPTRRFWHVALPHARPQLAVFIVLVVIDSWSDYLWPLLIANDSDHRTLSVAIRLLAGRSPADQLGVRAATTLLAILPLLVLVVVGLRFVHDDNHDQSTRVA